MIVSFLIYEEKQGLVVGLRDFVLLGTTSDSEHSSSSACSTDVCVSVRTRACVGMVLPCGSAPGCCSVGLQSVLDTRLLI